MFTANAEGTGPGAILNNIDYSLNTAANPVTRVGYADIYLTGAGAPYPMLPAKSVTVAIGGVPCPNVAYAGPRRG